MTLPANLILEKNKPNAQSAWVLLLDVWLTNGTLLQYARAHADLVFARPWYNNANVVAHYKLNDNGPNTVVADSTGNGYTGTLAGGDNTEDVSIAGQVNTAFDFDGAADYVDCGDPFESTFQDSFSISLWVKPDDGEPAASQHMLGVSTGAVNTVVINLQTGSGTVRAVYRANSNEAVAITNDDIFADGPAADWTHIVLVADATIAGPGGLSIYADGVKQTLNPSYDGDTSTVTFSEFSFANNFFIGTYDSSGSPANSYYSGGIDNVMIFNKALTQAEVDALYNSGTGTELIPNTYTAIGFDIDPTKLNNTGEIPTLDLAIYDVGLLLRPYLRSLNGGVGTTVRLIVANTSYPAEDLTELELEFEVLSTHSTARAVTFRLGAPQKLMQRFPLERDFALFCQFRFETAECGYTRKSVTNCTLSGSDPVQITATTHGFATGDSIRIADVGGITPSLDGTYVITYVDANNFTLDGTDSSNYTGPYTSGGTAGYSTCPRTLTACRDRENSTRFGGAPGLQRGGLRLV